MTLNNGEAFFFFLVGRGIIFLTISKVLSEGVAKNNPGAQTDETRDPEVWKGLGVWHPSDIWSLGVAVRFAPLTPTLWNPALLTFRIVDDALVNVADYFQSPRQSIRR